MISTSASDSGLHGSSTLGGFSKSKLTACLSIVLAAIVLQGCQGGTIRGITGQTGSQPGSPAHFFLQGDGVCGKVSIDFGDGTPPAALPNYDFSNLPQVAHNYTGWGGRKTVKAGSVENCIGEAKMIFTIGPPAYNVGFAQPLPTACTNVSASLNKPALRTNTIVHMKTNPSPNVKINFGCAFNGCILDADGRNSPAGAAFPFPGLREFSMVMRVGTQIVQGGTNVTFTTNQAGPLEVCVNDSDLFNNTGAWGLMIDIDESGAP